MVQASSLKHWDYRKKELQEKIFQPSCFFRKFDLMEGWADNENKYLEEASRLTPGAKFQSQYCGKQWAREEWSRLKAKPMRSTNRDQGLKSFLWIEKRKCCLFAWFESSYVLSANRQITISHMLLSLFLWIFYPQAMVLQAAFLP